jgi:PmbA protein
LSEADDKLGLIDVAEMAVKRCESLGADEAEAFIQKQRGIEVVLERGEIQSERSKTRQGIGIRLIKDKKLGFSYTSVLDKATVERICRNALRLAETSLSNPDWVSLPLPRKVPQTPAGAYDNDVANVSCEDALGLVIQGCDAVKRTDSRVSIDDGKFSAYAVEVAIANSHGISLTEKGTGISFVLVCMAKENDAVSSFAYEYDISRTLKGFSTERVGRLAAGKAAASLNPKSVETFEGDVLLNPDVAAEVLFGPVAGNVDADNVQRKRSSWADKIGGEVADPKLTLVDDGLLPFGVGSSPFDAEGVPCRRTSLIDGGVLKGFLYDSYTANKARAESTGNAARGDYGGLPSIAISNLLVEPGAKSFESLVSEVDRGIVVSRFSGNVNSQSGDFSGLVKQANYIEGGEVKFPLKETMISGNTFQALKDIIEIGSERRATMMGVYTPPILLRHIKIVSK